MSVIIFIGTIGRKIHRRVDDIFPKLKREIIKIFPRSRAYVAVRNFVTGSERYRISPCVLVGKTKLCRNVPLKVEIALRSSSVGEGNIFVS